MIVKLAYSSRDAFFEKIERNSSKSRWDGGPHLKNMRMYGRMVKQNIAETSGGLQRLRGQPIPLLAKVKNLLSKLHK